PGSRGIPGVHYTSYIHTCHMINRHSTSHSNTLSLHDALPIEHIAPGRLHLEFNFRLALTDFDADQLRSAIDRSLAVPLRVGVERSEEHTSELQSRENIVCRILLEKNKQMHWNVPRIVWRNKSR